MCYIYFMSYIGSIVIANLVLDQFVHFPIFGMLSYGTIFFAFIFTLRDHLHQFGLKIVFLAIFCAIVLNTLSCVLFEIPFRFILASFVSILVSELADTMVFERIKRRSWAFKVLTSNAISIPLDSLIFTLFAFLGVLSGNEVIEIVFADIIVKYSIAALMIARPYLFRRIFNFISVKKEMRCPL